MVAPLAGHQWRHRHTVLVIVTAGNFAQFGARIVLGPIVPDLIAAFDVSKGTIGLALTVLWGTYALLQFPSGVLADRYGERRVLATALGLAGVGGGLLAAAPNFAAFAVFAAFLGAGTGLFLTGGITMVSRLYRNTGQALGLLTTGSGTAGLIGPPVAAALAARFGWRVVPLLSAVAALCVTGFVLWKIEPVEAPGRPRSARLAVDPATILAILRRPAVLYTLGLAVIVNFTFQALVSFFPVFLVEYWSVSIGTASLAFGALFVGFTVGQPVMGDLSDRYGRDGVLAVEAAAMTAGLGLLLVGGGAAVLVAGVVGIAVGLTWFAVVNARITDIFSEAQRGTGLGLIRTVTMFVGATGSLVVGVVVDAAGWVEAFGLLIGLLIVALGALGANRALGAGL